MALTIYREISYLSARQRGSNVEEAADRRRSLHGGGPSRSSPMMPFEWPHYPSRFLSQINLVFVHE